jgi:hypothetical protein
MLLSPIIGDWRARQIGVAIGSLLILLVAWLTIRWIGARTRSETLAVGLLWLVAMLLAEVTLGRSVFGYEWSRIAEDFDLARGGLLGIGMAVLLIAPWLAPDSAGTGLNRLAVFRQCLVLTFASTACVNIGVPPEHRNRAAVRISLRPVAYDCIDSLMRQGDERPFRLRSARLLIPVRVGGRLKPTSPRHGSLDSTRART